MVLKNQNLDLFSNHIFPKTRYQGSKYKHISWIRDILKNINFNTALDAFSGTSSISYLMKDMGKKVYCNDKMLFNYYVSKALIENNEENITDKDLEKVLKKDSSINYNFFIKETFKGIYYTDDENEWLDILIQNINSISNINKKSMLYWALYQACLIKRPYNLFHRKNLHIREANVERSFGNKKTWDTSFETHFIKFVQEINNSIFSNKKEHKSYCKDIFELKIDDQIDLVYLDPPYIPINGSITEYDNFYHFLNGLSDYDNWKDKIDYNSKNLKIKSCYSLWEDKDNILKGFKKVITKFKKSKIVISYRSDGIPSIEEITKILEFNKKIVKVYKKQNQYALSKSKTEEVIIIGE